MRTGIRKGGIDDYTEEIVVIIILIIALSILLGPLFNPRLGPITQGAVRENVNRFVHQEIDTRCVGSNDDWEHDELVFKFKNAMDRVVWKDSWDKFVAYPKGDVTPINASSEKCDTIKICSTSSSPSPPDCSSSSGGSIGGGRQTIDIHYKASDNTVLLVPQ